ncbi:helix-turn-helix transcriptional regulator [Hoeflea sp.]|uniref:helix-turn-helix transcriptional regulator n=1 Tax=Hoeflea sp. TaxID=1940281 RepID=UPI003B013192
MTSTGEDFASATMMRLVAAGLAAQGIGVPVAAPVGAHVPRGKKRDLLHRVLQEHGAKTILAISDAAPNMPPEPVVLALRKARDVPDLLGRWARLETFSHGRHRVVTDQTGPGTFELRHIAKDGRSRPSSAESLLVFGLLTRLCESLGAEPVLLEDQDGHVWRKDGAWFAPAFHDVIQNVVLTARSSPRPDMPPENPTQDSHALRQTIADDPVRRWTLKSLARHAGMSQRTLQRRLAQQSTSFSQVLSEVRLQVAADHLCATDGPGLAEIGFLAGYADQAHFARSFRHGVGTTPKRYRAAFQDRPA